MTNRVGAKGQVVIPKELRDRFGIRPGDEVNFWDCDDHVALTPVRCTPDSLMGRFRRSDMAAQLLEERRADRLREDGPNAGPESVHPVVSFLRCSSWRSSYTF